MKSKIRLRLFITLLFGIMLVGCSSKSGRTESAPQYDNKGYEGTAENSIADSPVMEEVGIESNSPKQNKTQKLIYRANMTIEITDKPGPIVESLQGFIESHNGYIENIEQYQNGYDPVTGENLERIYMSIRIPHEHYNNTLQNISKLGTVISKSSTVEDVTLQYSDIESSLKMYKIEQDRLLEMLQNKAVDVKDMIEIEKRLSEVRVEIEKQESARRALESLINYDTITLEINQVRRAGTDNETRTFGSRVKSTFIQSIDEAIIFMQDVILAITYLVIPVTVIVIVGGVLYIPARKVIEYNKNRKKILKAKMVERVKETEVKIKE